MLRPLHIHIYKTAGTSIRMALGIADPINLTAPELRAHVGEQEWAAGLPFAVVRNPWERFVSLYTYLYQRKQGDLGLQFQALNLSFDPWLRTVLAQENEAIPMSVGDLTAFHWAWARPQSTWLGLLVAPENVLRFERLAQQWPELLDRLERPWTPLGRERVSTSRPECWEVYTRDLQRLVGEKCRIDIESFGYAFPEKP